MADLAHETAHRYQWFNSEIDACEKAIKALEAAKKNCGLMVQRAKCKTKKECEEAFDAEIKKEEDTIAGERQAGRK